MKIRELASVSDPHADEARARSCRFVATILLAVTGLAMTTVLVPAAYAVPSFARQTGMACAACHTVFPELTPFGRQFKLGGYTLANLKTVRDISMNRVDTLQLNEIPPLSVMFQASVTSTGKSVPDSGVPTAQSQNTTVEFPDQLSLFYAGAIASKLGAFSQITYDAEQHFSLDNTDIRFSDNLSNQQRDLIFGVTANNNPTVTDPWNSTPAWGFPFASSPTAPGPTAATQIDGTLADNGVAGLSAYVWWMNAFYAEAGLYRSLPQGQVVPLDSTASEVIKGIVPYWRFAYQHQWNRNSLEVGTYGLYDELYPGGGTTLAGRTDNYTDIAVDSEYQYIGDQNIVSLLATYIHEDQKLDASSAAGGSNSSDTLQTFRLTGNYYYERRYGISLSYFNTWGSKDTALYAPNPVDGSASGSPDSSGETVQLSYLPWLNTKFALQYTMYNKFNGGGSNYDGSGRSASDNNTLYFLGWVNF